MKIKVNRDGRKVCVSLLEILVKAYNWCRENNSTNLLAVGIELVFFQGIMTLRSFSWMIFNRSLRKND